jgi:hypothetical protein
MATQAHSTHSCSRYRSLGSNQDISSNNQYCAPLPAKKIIKIVYKKSRYFHCIFFNCGAPVRFSTGYLETELQEALILAAD